MIVAGPGRLYVADAYCNGFAKLQSRLVLLEAVEDFLFQAFIAQFAPISRLPCRQREASFPLHHQHLDR